jgi:hypothetical protein
VVCPRESHDCCNTFWLWDSSILDLPRNEIRDLWMGGNRRAGRAVRIVVCFYSDGPRVGIGNGIARRIPAARELSIRLTHYRVIPCASAIRSGGCVTRPGAAHYTVLRTEHSVLRARSSRHPTSPKTPLKIRVLPCQSVARLLFSCASLGPYPFNRRRDGDTNADRLECRSRTHSH